MYVIVVDSTRLIVETCDLKDQPIPPIRVIPQQRQPSSHPLRHQLQRWPELRIRGTEVDGILALRSQRFPCKVSVINYT
jgi:hypothetical protein